MSGGFGIEKIKKIIPHREPFLFLDEVVNLNEGKDVIAKKKVREDEFWVKGHFPNFAVYPGVVAVEMLRSRRILILSLKGNECNIVLFGGFK